MFQGRIKPVPEMVERERLDDHARITGTSPEWLDQLESEIALLRNGNRRTPSGLWQLTFAYPHVSWMTERDFAEAGDVFERWKANGVIAPAPFIYRALVLEERMRKATQPPLAAADPEKVVAEFARRRSAFETFLADARSIASNDPVWYSLAIRAASLTCDRRHEVERLGDALLDKPSMKTIAIRMARFPPRSTRIERGDQHSKRSPSRIAAAWLRSTTLSGQHVHRQTWCLTLSLGRL